jgi:hypothetical protein
VGRLGQAGHYALAFDEVTPRTCANKAYATLGHAILGTVHQSVDQLVVGIVRLFQKPPHEVASAGRDETRDIFKDKTVRFGVADYAQQLEDQAVPRVIGLSFAAGRMTLTRGSFDDDATVSDTQAALS